MLGPRTGELITSIEPSGTLDSKTTQETNKVGQEKDNPSPHKVRNDAPTSASVALLLATSPGCLFWLV